MLDETVKRWEDDFERIAANRLKTSSDIAAAAAPAEAMLVEDLKKAKWSPRKHKLGRKNNHNPFYLKPPMPTEP